MAAGLGFKTFNTGDVLSAADVNGYLMQGVLVFADATARDAAITSPQEGQFAYTKNNDSLWYYSGSAWVASGATGDIEGVTAGTGISGGGTSGTVTITNSMATAIDAKGDLVVGTGADTFSRLAVGTNGYTLVADSAESTGLKWAAPASGSTFAGVSLTRSTSLSLATSTSTKVGFDIENFDTDGYHSNTTNNTRITIPSGKAGYYLFTGNLAIGQSATAMRGVEIYKNNTQNYCYIYTPGVSGADIAFGFSTVIYGAVGDYFEMSAYQNSGSTLTLRASVVELAFIATYLGA